MISAWSGVRWLFIILAVIVAYPLVFTTADLWDGVIIEHAADTRNMGVFDTWFYESGWPLVSELYKSIFWVVDGYINYKIAINIVIVVCTALSGLELYRISKVHFRFGHIPSLLGAALLLVAPFLPLYLSSIFLMHAVFIYLCLLGARWYLEEGRIRKLVGLILVLISFQHNSNPVLFASLLFGVYLFGERKKEARVDVLALLVLAVGVILYKWYFPPSGLYDGYNSIDLGWLLNQRVLLRWLKFILFYCGPLVVCLVVAIFYKVRRAGLVLIFFLAACLNVIPYMVVGKYPYIINIYNSQAWDYRYAINFFVILSIVFAGFVDTALKSQKKKVVVPSLAV